ncbi:MAG: DNA repair protein RadA [Clostridia bacterium]|nr:DNA repair protein RadA [Clostridia bacterium]
MKQKTVFVCSECGTESPKWNGKCPGCGAWNTMNEEKVLAKPARSSSGAAAFAMQSEPPKTLRDISITEDIRIHTGLGELDRVLGGGIVPGSLVLIGGDPGIGKSTILLQICEYLGKTNKILYVSGEESQSQIKLRANRLSVSTENLKLYTETNMALICECILREKPDILIVDSVQTMFNPEISPAPGSVTQIRDTAATLMRIAKEQSIATFLVGHVTKEGSIAGPKILEHIVDSVLYFEGEQHRAFRIIRAIKNRFGSTNEIGVFEMTSDGLHEIPNPSEAMLSGRPAGEPGSCIICTMEGTRPVLAEIQALAAQSSFGNARRTSTGIDLTRVLIILAVMDKRIGLHISSYDVYVNVVGGLRMVEPAIDMGVFLAIASSFRNKPIPEDVVAIGEIGLTGELRSCSYLENRIAEAEKLGFKRCLIPPYSREKLKKFKKIEISSYTNIRDVVRDIL